MDMKGFKFESPGALSHHAAVTVIYDKYGSWNTKMLTLYNESNQRRKAPSQEMLIEGVYFFGGKDSKGELSNKLYILQIGRSPLRWMSP